MGAQPDQNLIGGGGGGAENPETPRGGGFEPDSKLWRGEGGEPSSDLGGGGPRSTPGGGGGNSRRGRLSPTCLQRLEGGGGASERGKERGREGERGIFEILKGFPLCGTSAAATTVADEGDRRFSDLGGDGVRGS
ncbi:hypothetical protein TIFTF001_013014 [Ficus carica]|uniref:Uncharacterized protein n=1 Tax=Ficus carica TaxID=3494 RepID=A0AA88AH14_FICCA|nr:hypothetical protein TIFTF001_013014 [Ficus carica]